MLIWTFFTRRKSQSNYASALCNFIALTFLVVSLADERWFYLHGGRCNRNVLGLKTFFTPGKLYQLVNQDEIYLYKNFNKIALTACVDPRSIFLLRMIITLMCLAIFSTLIALILDLIRWKWMRRYAIWQICSVFLCTLILILCFYLSEMIYQIQSRTRMKLGQKVDVQYDIGYYLLVLANNFSLLSIMITLIRRDSNEIDESREETESIVHFIERAEPARMITEPPPAYSE